MDISSNMLLINGAWTSKTEPSRQGTAAHSVQQTIEFIFSSIELVRAHRACLYRQLSSNGQAIRGYNSVKLGLMNASKNVNKYAYLGTHAERHSLSKQLHQLTLTPSRLTLNQQLIGHGKVIRALFYCCDHALIKCIDSHKVPLRRYSEQWQTIMDAVDGLTQYRLAVIDHNHGVENSLALMISKGEILLRRLSLISQKYGVTTPSFLHSNRALAESISDLKDSEQQLRKRVSGSLLYKDTSLISLELIKVYKQMVDQTLLATVGLCQEKKLLA